MKTKKNILSSVTQFILMAFTIGYCYFGTEVFLVSKNKSCNVEIIKQEYFEALFVGLCAAIFTFIGTLIFNKK